jgi:hypothetical protein
MAPIDVRKVIPAAQTTSGDSDSAFAKKRRSTRVVIEIAVTVFAQDLNGKIFEEKANTVTVSNHGACVVLSADIDPQKPALLVNEKTKAEIQCRVAHRQDIGNGKREVGFEFSEPLPRVWGIGFPPENWDPAERKKPVWTQKANPTPAERTKK